MYLKRLVFVGFLGAFMVGCASNGTSTSDEPVTVDVKVVEGSVDPTTAGGKDPNEVVCTRRHQVGSHFPRTTCKSRREWDQDRAEAQRDLDRQRQHNAATALEGARTGDF